MEQGEIMRIAICDDMEWLRKNLIKNIREFYGSDDLEIEEFEDGKFLLEKFTLEKYDLIILDYYMKQMNGKLTADAIREIDQKVMIVFATSEDFYFSEDTASLRVNKPISKKDFDRVMKIFEKRKTIESNTYFYFSEYGQKKCRFVKSIGYIRGKDIYLDYRHVTTDEDVVISNERGFYNTQKGYQINMDHIRKLEWCKVLFLGEEMIEINWKDYLRLKKQLKLFDKEQGKIRIC